MASTWSVRLQNLHVDNADEDGWLSDGDEPYLVLISFRSRFGKPGSTEVKWRGMLDDEWAENSDAGEDTPIPEKLGVATFANVLNDPFSLFGGVMPELLGVVVLAFESDGTPFSSVRSKMKEARDALGKQLERIVAERTLTIDPLLPPAELQAQLQAQFQPFLADIGGAITAVKDELEYSTSEKIGKWLESFSDPDDLVGMDVRFWLTINQGLVDAIEDPAVRALIPVLKAEPYRHEFKASSVRYTVTGEVTMDDTGTIGGPITVADPSVKYTAVWKPGRRGEIQLYGVPYERYRATYDELWPQGWRLQQLAPHVVGTQVLYTAVWKPGTGSEIQLYGVPYEQYRAKYDELWPQGWRLQQLAPYVVGNQVFYTAVWKPGRRGEIQLYGVPYEQYRAKYDELWPQGWRLQQLAPYVVGNQVFYSAVWKPGTGSEIQLYGVPYEQYRAKYDELWPQGWRLQQLAPYVVGNQVFYTAVWKPGTGSEIQLYGVPYEQYRAKYDELWPQGWRLQQLAPYVVA